MNELHVNETNGSEAEQTTALGRWSQDNDGENGGVRY